MNTNQGNQILILNCCYSGAATRGFASKQDLSPRLINENRAILTSSIPWQSFSNRQKYDLSIYTHYLVKGLKTGLADYDHDNDRLISVNDLYRYVKRKLRESGLKQELELLAYGKAREIYLTTRKETRELESASNSHNIAVLIESEQDELTNLNLLTDIPLIIQALKSKNSNIRQRATEILGDMQSEDAVLVLSQLLLEDENINVRSSAAEALGEIYEKQGA